MNTSFNNFLLRDVYTQYAEREKNLPEAGVNYKVQLLNM